MCCQICDYEAFADEDRPKSNFTLNLLKFGLCYTYLKFVWKLRGITLLKHFSRERLNFDSTIALNVPKILSKTPKDRILKHF